MLAGILRFISLPFSALCVGKFDKWKVKQKPLRHLTGMFLLKQSFMGAPGSWRICWLQLNFIHCGKCAIRCFVSSLFHHRSSGQALKARKFIKSTSASGWERDWMRNVFKKRTHEQRLQGKLRTKEINFMLKKIHYAIFLKYVHVDSINKRNATSSI